MYRFWEPILKELCYKLKPKTIVEVGSEDGYNSELILDFCVKENSKLIVIEPFPKFDVVKFKEKYSNHFILHQSLSLSALPLIKDYELIFIDGDHNWYTVFNELKNIEKTVKKNNSNFPVIVLHDTGWPYARRDLYYNPENIPQEYINPYKKAGIIPGSTELLDGDGVNYNYFNSIYENTEKNGVRTAVEDFLEQSEEEFEVLFLPVISGLGILCPKKLLKTNQELLVFIEQLKYSKHIESLLKAVESDRNKILLSYVRAKKGEKHQAEWLKEVKDRNELLVEDYEKRIEILENEKEKKLLEFQKKEELLKVREEKLLQAEINHRRRKLLDKNEYLLKRFNFSSHLIEEQYISLNQIRESKRYKIGNKIINIVKKNESHPFIFATNQYKDFKSWHQKNISSFLESKKKILSSKSSLDLCEKNLNNLKSKLNNLDQYVEALQFSIDEVLNSKRYKLGEDLVNLYKRLTSASNRHAPWAPEFIADRFKEYLSIKNNEIQFKGSSLAKGEDSNRYDLTDTRIIQFIPRKTANPYYTIIPEELIKRGLEVEFTVDKEKIKTLLNDRSFDKQIIHFHQLEPFYHSKNNSLSETREKARDIINLLSEFKELGAILVWTKHNPLPHDRTYSEIDLFVIKIVSNLVDKIITLGKFAKNEMSHYVPANIISVARHPSFKNVYGEKATKAKSRSKYGYDSNDFVFGVVGEIKPYKGIEFIIDGFKNLKKQNPNSDLKLLIAGPAKSESYLKELKLKATEDINFLPERIADESIPEVLSVLDASLFAFRALWGSSSVVLSLSYGIPVISPDIGCISEYVLDDINGILYKSGDAKDFVHAMNKFYSSPLKKHMQYMSKEFNREFALGEIADEFEEIYKEVVNG